MALTVQNTMIPYCTQYVDTLTVHNMCLHPNRKQYIDPDRKQYVGTDRTQYVGTDRTQYVNTDRT